MMTKTTQSIFASILIVFTYACNPKSEEKSSQESDLALRELLDSYPSIEKEANHQVLTLGTFHFDRARDASDIIAKEHIDISTHQNQKELDTIIEKLIQFQPDKIAVEWRPNFQKVMDSLYNQYLQGNYNLGKHETFQIGFELAKKLGRTKVYCIDNNPPFSDFINTLDDWEKYADSLGHLNLWRAYDAENGRFNQYMDTIQKHLSVTDYLKIINSPKHAKRTKQLWLTGLVDVDHEQNYLGADVVARWYRRNIRLFSTAKNLVEEDENLLIIYGGAHKWILDELFESSPDFEVIQFNDVSKD